MKADPSVALVVLASDSLEAVIPRYTSDQWKLLCFIVYVYGPLSWHLIWYQTDGQCLTTQFRPTSILVIIILHWSINYMGDYWNLDILGSSYVSPYPSSSYSDTFLSIRMERPRPIAMGNELMVREHSPGSLREPMQTSLWPAHGMVKLGTTFGLIAAAVCPYPCTK